MPEDTNPITEFIKKSVPLQHSTRLRGTKFLNSILLFTRILFMPTHLYSEPINEIQEKNLKINFEASMKPVINDSKIEELRAFHMNIDRINSIIDHDPNDKRWKIEKIIKHIVKTNSDGTKNIYCKIKYYDGDFAYHTMDSLKNEDPIILAKYGIENNLTKFPEWDWVKHYIRQNPVRNVLTTVLIASTGTGPKYKFGVEVPRNVKHAFRN
jgi:hypothetical protein